MTSIGDLDEKTTALFVCDFQSYYNTMLRDQYDFLLTNNFYLIKACEELKIPIIFTKHKGYDELETKLEAGNHKVFEKTKYSMWDSNLSSYFKENYPHVKSIMITGFETHVCLFQTVIDLKREGYETHLISDASTSVDRIEENNAIQRIKQNGTFIISTEMALLQLIKDDTHPNTEIIYKLNSDRIRQNKEGSQVNKEEALGYRNQYSE